MRSECDLACFNQPLDPHTPCKLSCHCNANELERQRTQLGPLLHLVCQSTAGFLVPVLLPIQFLVRATLKRKFIHVCWSNVSLKRNRNKFKSTIIHTQTHIHSHTHSLRAKGKSEVNSVGRLFTLEEAKQGSLYKGFLTWQLRPQ